MNKEKILVLLPAFNESGSIKKTVTEILRLDLGVDVVVIDDGSTDDTAKQARLAGVPVIQLPFNLGIGGAVQTGFLYAVQRHYDLAAQVDGDGQHDAGYLKKILQPVLDGQADIVVGSRFVTEDAMSEGLPAGFVAGMPRPSGRGAGSIGSRGSWRSSAVRRVGIHFFAWLISGLTGYQVTDPTSGFRAFSREAILAFAEEYPQDFPEPESIMTARRLGFRLIEVPVEMRKRSHGHSSIRYLKTLYYMIKVTLAILLDMLKKRKAVTI